ncbi:winged helix-turn-helix domain-containing protein [Streptomyces sp. bgisy034]|uniref:winged helix-turn-helix domain-containing protein n=1 Tax=Streptomyces sp. bgisy034 TaxID=3413774 RepID=UPI003EBD4864
MQRGHRQDLMVLAHVAAPPGAEARGIARAVGTPERVVARNLSRLTENGLVALVDDEHPALRCYRLTS